MMANKYKVIDNEFNRMNYPDLIGDVLDNPPAYANVELIQDRKSMEDIFNKSKDDAQKFAVRCFRAGYEQDEIIKGISQFFEKSPEDSRGIFNGAIMQMTKLGPYSRDKKSSKESWYKEAQIQSMGNNEYANSITPDIWMPGVAGQNFDVEAEPVLVPFSIDFEARSWGVKDVTIYASKTIIVTVNITQWGDDKDTVTEKDIMVDLGQLKDEHEHHGHGAYTVTELDLYLDDKMEVDYNESTITFSKG